MTTTPSAELNGNVKRGDLNGDGKISVTDYLLIKRVILGTLRFQGEYLKAADVDADGVLSATDYILVKKHMMELSDLYII